MRGFSQGLMCELGKAPCADPTGPRETSPGGGQKATRDGRRATRPVPGPPRGGSGPLWCQHFCERVSLGSHLRESRSPTSVRKHNLCAPALPLMRISPNIRISTDQSERVLSASWRIAEHCGASWRIVEHCGALWRIVAHCGASWPWAASLQVWDPARPGGEFPHDRECADSRGAMGILLAYDVS